MLHTNDMVWYICYDNMHDNTTPRGIMFHKAHAVILIVKKYTASGVILKCGSAISRS